MYSLYAGLQLCRGTLIPQIAHLCVIEKNTINAHSYDSFLTQFFNHELSSGDSPRTGPTLVGVDDWM